MNYHDMVEFARRSLPIERVKIVGGQTRGYVKCPEPTESNLTSLAPAKKGTDYAAIYKLQDEMEDYNRDHTNKQRECDAAQGMSAVEELSASGGCFSNPLDLVNDDLVQVYENYSFTNEYDMTLPVSSYKEEILAQIDVSQVTIIKGHTGCGKTTQVPQYILDSYVNQNMHCNIVVTQPRRIAAISVAKRVCEERKWALGSIVGYKIALDKSVSEDTRLLYCTTGVLLHQLINKCSLSQYTHIIVDEVHEREQDTDFLLIILKKFLRSPGCRTKVILMSATFNTNKFSDYFSKKVNGIKIDPPIIEVDHSIRYPVYTYYIDSLVGKFPVKVPQISLDRPLIEDSAYDLACLLIEAFHTIDKSEQKQLGFVGSVLVFLPGIHEIEVMFEKLYRHNNSKNNEKWSICPLHSSITFEEQLKVFKSVPKGHRKIILATNIAESSITVPDVKYVIDFCLIKLLVQEPETNYTSLKMTWISKSQGCQRAGRVGRVMPGRVYRLVPEQMYEEFDEECIPEMLRSPLDQTILRAKALNIGSPVSTLARALDPPDLTNIYRTILLLKEAGALLLTSNGKYEEDDGDFTFIGRVMSVLPLDTHLSKLIILGHMFSILNDCVIMACAMAVKSMFSSPFKQQLEAYNSKLCWADSSCSDPIAFLNAYKVWRYQTNSGKFKRSGGLNEEDWAKRYFIQLQSMKEVARLEGEVHIRLKNLGIMEMGGDSKITWEDRSEKAIILKFIIAGAFYPNYFIRRPIDEKEAVKVLGGRNPFTTIYLTGMPLNQPGILYSNAIKRHFEHCGSQISVSFDGSSKVYLQFGSSKVVDSAEAKFRAEMKSPPMPGNISLAVYRAIKLRHLQIPVTIHLLSPKVAENRARSLLGEYRPQTFCWSQKKERTPKHSILPSLSTNFMQVTLSHIDSPSKFWVQPHDAKYQDRLLWIHSTLNNYPMQPLKEVKIGRLCVAPYTDEVKCYYRAKITEFCQRDAVIVFFIDYGNSERVNIKELRDYSPQMVAWGIKDEPEMAIECVLSEIQPLTLRNPNGTWSDGAITIFKNTFTAKSTIAQIYSVVGNVMSVNLLLPECLNACEKRVLENSFNKILIAEGYAEQVDEPYLSRDNHMSREMAFNSPDSLQLSFAPEPIEQDIDIESPSEKECRLKVDLKGPKSPLEMSFYSVSRKSQGMDINVEWSSVNSVLLDTHPMDPHNRMLVGGFVTQNTAGDRLTLRNTTLMPNIHGLPALITMVFAPRVQLRTDSNRTHLTGAICGLGYDPQTKKPYHSENDIELTFDTKFELSDLEVINKLRYWMNSIVFGGLNWEEEISRPSVCNAQAKIQKYTMELLTVKRDSIGTKINFRPFVWGLIEEAFLLHPQGIDDGKAEGEEDATIFPLIWGVQLNTKMPGDMDIINNFKKLEDYSEGRDLMRGGVLCKLCQVYLDSLQNLKLHLKSSVHQESKRQFESTAA